MHETIFRIASKEDAKSINDISKNELGYSDCTESLVLQKLQKIDFENEVVFVAEYKNKVIGFIHAQIYDVILRKHGKYFRFGCRFKIHKKWNW